MSISAMKQALEALEKLWDIIDDIDTYGDMAKSDDKLYRSLVERRQRDSDNALSKLEFLQMGTN